MRNILKTALSSLGVKYTGWFSDRVYDKNPDRDNLFGLSRMLQVYGISTAAYGCDSLADLFSVPTPSIISSKEGFYVLTGIDSQYVTIRNESGKRRLSINKFSRLWTRTVMTLSPEAYIEPDYEDHLKKDRVWKTKLYVLMLSFGIIVLIVLHKMSYIYHVMEWIMLSLDIVALFVCSLLLEKQMTGRSSIGERICLLFSTDGCGNSHSQSDNVLPLSISLPEIGFGYFLSNAIVLLLFPDATACLSMICLIAVCVPIWSILSQYRKKRWCVLCLMIQIIVILMALCSVLTVNGHGFDISIKCLEAWGVYPTSIITISVLSSLIERHILKNRLLLRTSRIAFDGEVFHSMLERERHCEIAEDITPIILGDPSAKNTVTVVSSLHCGACAEMHGKIESLLEFRKDIRVQYILVSTDESLDIETQYMIQAFVRDKRRGGFFLKEWYTHGNIGCLSSVAESGMDLITTDILGICNRQKYWARRSGITKTPTVFVNGYELSGYYSFLDLAYVDFE